MKKFLYKAKGANGKIVTGTVTAQNEFEAENVLVKHNLIAMELRSAAVSPFSFLSFFSSKVSSKDKSIFARQLSTMIGAGLTLPKSIKVASTQARNEKLKSIYLDVYKDLEEGTSFSIALSKHPEAFDQVFVSVVGAGEATGKLDVVLKQIANQLENDNNFASKVKGAMYYPAFILLALVGIGGYMMVKVIPTLKTLFDQQGAALPIATKILLALSNFLVHYWWAALLIVLGVAIFLKFFFDSDSGAAVKDKLQVKTPGFKTLFENMYMYRLTQILSMLLGAGVPLLSALKIGATVVNNGVYEESLLGVVKYVERGVPLSVQLMKDPVFPELIGQMAAVGEETGQLDQVLLKVSEYYAEATDNMIKTISTLIEPMILIVMGAAVAFLVFAVLVPIYQISQVAG